jgi:hypothetical protein
MTFAMAAVLFTARAETRQAATIAATEQHFTIISSGQGQFPETFVLDTRNGRVWMMHGQVRKQPFLIPCSYNLPDGNANLVPLEADTEIGRAQQMPQSASDAQTPNDASKKLEQDMNRLFPK